MWGAGFEIVLNTPQRVKYPHTFELTTALFSQ
jgi:hypothetical protein